MGGHLLLLHRHSYQHPPMMDLTQEGVGRVGVVHFVFVMETMKVKEQRKGWKINTTTKYNSQP